MAALAASLVPLLLLRYPGTQDGPSHLATARVLLGYGDAAHPIYARFYRIDTFPSPNLATEGLLTGLVAWLPPIAAEKVLAGLYLVALPVVLRAVLRRVGPTGRWLAYAGFPLANGFLFASGFYNYCYGVVVFVAGCGWIFAARERPARRQALGLCLLLLLAYLTHFIPAALLALVALVPPTAGALHRPRTRAVLPELLRRLWPTLLAMVPFAVLTAIFLARPAPGPSKRDNPLGLLIQLPLLFKPVVALSYAEYVGAAVLGLTLVGLAALALRRRGRAACTGRAGQLAAAAGLCSLLYLVAPEGTSQGGAINARLALFPPLLLLFWLALVQRPDTLRPVLRGGAVAVFLGVAVFIAAVRWPIEQRHVRDVTAYAQAARLVRPGSTVLGLQFASANVPKVRGFSDPTLHGASLVATLTQSVDVGHYEAELSYFPTRFRSDNDPRRRIDPGVDGLDHTPSTVDLLRAPTTAGGLVDYVLLRGDTSDVPVAKRPGAERIVAQLSEAYRLIGTFGGPVPVRLYERSPRPPADLPRHETPR